MKPLSLKLREDIFKDVEIVVKAIHVPRNAYINDALLLYNQLHKRKLLKKRLCKESAATCLSSMEILAVMEQLEDGLPE